MILMLLSHQWKAFWRRRGAAKALILRLLVGLVLLYFLVASFVLGFSIQPLLLYFFPGQDPPIVFCGLLLYYFTIDLSLRLLMQGLPVLATRPYLLQNIKRRQLVTFLNIRSLFHFLNLLPVCIFFPFIFTAVKAEFGAAPSLALSCLVALLTLFNHFLILYIQRKSAFNSWWLVGFLSVNILFLLLERYHVLSLRSVSATVSLHVLSKPLLALLFIFPPVLVYLVNSRFLYNNLYFEELSGQDRYKRGSEYRWLRRWGIIGELMGLDIRLILRNRQPRTAMLLSACALIQIAFMQRFADGHPLSFGMLFFYSIAANAAFLTSYGANAFAWQSSHFDGILSSNIRPRDYIRSKFYLFTTMATAVYIISLLFGLMDTRMIPMLTAAWLYNIGCNVVVIVWCGTYGYRPVDLGKALGFAFQGLSTAHTYYLILLMVPPFLIYELFFRLFHPWAAVIAIGATGVLGLLLRRWFISLVIRAFYYRKYLILQGFREK